MSKYIMAHYNNKSEHFITKIAVANKFNCSPQLVTKILTGITNNEIIYDDYKVKIEYIIDEKIITDIEEERAKTRKQKKKENNDKTIQSQKNHLLDEIQA